MEKLAIAVGVILLSIPLHEFCHLICIWLLGDRRPRKVEWFSIKKDGLLSLELGGAVYIEDGIRLSKFLRGFCKKHYKVIGFAIGFSGGFGAAILLSTVSFLLLSAGLNIWKPFVIVAGFQLLYSVREGISVAKNTIGYKEILEESAHEQERT